MRFQKKLVNSCFMLQITIFNIQKPSNSTPQLTSIKVSISLGIDW